MVSTKRLKFYGPKFLNNRPVNIKTTEKHNGIKNLIKKWNGFSCNCIVCTQQQFINNCFNKNIVMCIKNLKIC